MTLAPALQTLTSRIAGLRDLPARTALRVTNLAPLRRRLATRYEAAIAAHRHALPVLEGIDRLVVEGLRRDGVFVTSLRTLQLEASNALLRRTTLVADEFAGEARRRAAAGADGNFVPAELIGAHPDIFAWGLQDRLRAIVECYLELPIGYDGVCLNYTVADGREVATRKWHRDWEDRRMLKVAIYLNDVDGTGGPFEIVKQRDAVQTDSSGFRYATATDAKLEQQLGEGFRASIESCEGSAGTVIFADTAGFFHRGRPATGADRKAVFFSYIARRPRHPFFCERSGMSRAQIRRQAAGLSEAQRAAVFWRRELPLLVQLIPPARI